MKFYQRSLKLYIWPDIFITFAYIVIHKSLVFQENEVKKGNEDKKKKNKNKKNKQHRVPKEEIRDRSGAVVEAGEAMFQVQSVS